MDIILEQPNSIKTKRMSFFRVLLKTFLLMIVLFLATFKFEQFIGGLLNCPEVNIFRLIALLGLPLGFIWLIVAVCRRRDVWLPLIILLYSQPYLPDPMYPYTVGLYCRIGSSNIVPETRKWASQLSEDEIWRLQFPQSDPNAYMPHRPLTTMATGYERDAYERPIYILPERIPESLRQFGCWRVSIDPRTRNVFLGGGGHFIGYWSLVIGKGVGNKYLSSPWNIRINDDAYLSSCLGD